jgi:hypothetical protein
MLQALQRLLCPFTGDRQQHFALSRYAHFASYIPHQ